MSTPTPQPDLDELREQITAIASKLADWQGYYEEAKKNLPEGTREFVDDASWAGEQLKAERIRLSVADLITLITAHTEKAVLAAEDKVIEIAHRKPCDCGSKDHLPTPVRSVQGPVTYYCQFSYVTPSATTPKEEKI